MEYNKSSSVEGETNRTFLKNAEERKIAHKKALDSYLGFTQLTLPCAKRFPP